MSKSPEEKHLTLELVLDSPIHLYSVDIRKHGVGVVDESVPACPQG